MQPFRVERKDPCEFIAISRPWKVTNGVVCGDYATPERALAAADRLNGERGLKTPPFYLADWPPPAHWRVLRARLQRWWRRRRRHWLIRPR